MQYYIYITTNLINGKQYIGQHKGKLNDSYFGSGTNVMKALAKYGKQNFKKDILQICETREEADKWEQYYIAKYQAVENDSFYNLQEGGTGGDGWRACKRWRETHPAEAKKLDQINIKRLQQWQQDNPEKRYELSIKPMLEASHQWQKDNSEKVIKHMKKVNEAKEKWQKEHPEEHQQQVNAWRKAGSDANSQQIICITTGEVFDSQSAAARFYNIPQTNISKCIRGERKSAGKHPITKEKMVWRLCEKN